MESCTRELLSKDNSSTLVASVVCFSHVFNRFDKFGKVDEKIGAEVVFV